MKTLIVYGTRYGATAGTSDEIAKVLGEEGFEVHVVNIKKEKVTDISEYELIIIGSGMRINRWVKEAENFLKKFQKELATKKVALFVSSGVRVLLEHEGNTEKLEQDYQNYLVEKARKYSLNPIALAIFGGVIDYNKMGFFFKRTLGPLRQKFEAAGIVAKNDVYDTRDWAAIRSWAQELAQKAQM